MPAIICDLDGTLSDHKKRAHLAVARDWDAYNAEAINDDVHLEVLEFLRDARFACPECELILLTARNEKWRGLTLDWLRRGEAFSLFDFVLMRPREDTQTSDAVLKPRMLANHFGSMELAKKEVRMILEDRSTVVRAWRDLGFVSWQVRDDISQDAVAVLNEKHG